MAYTLQYNNLCKIEVSFKTPIVSFSGAEGFDCTVIPLYKPSPSSKLHKTCHDDGSFSLYAIHNGEKYYIHEYDTFMTRHVGSPLFGAFPESAFAPRHYVIENGKITVQYAPSYMYLGIEKADPYGEDYLFEDPDTGKLCNIVPAFWRGIPLKLREDAFSRRKALLAHFTAT